MVLSSAGSSGWVPSPFPGVSYQFLKLDGTNPAVVALRKIDAGAVMPPHRHPTVERNYLISGQATILNGTTINAGAYMEIPAGERHGATAISECIFHDSYDGSLVWVEDSGVMTAVTSTGTFNVLGTMNAPNAADLDL
jgi:quercetin dioxygenase-like cupin family protein